MEVPGWGHAMAICNTLLAMAPSLLLAMALSSIGHSTSLLAMALSPLLAIVMLFYWL